MQRGIGRHGGQLRNLAQILLEGVEGIGDDLSHVGLGLGQAVRLVHEEVQGRGARPHEADDPRRDHEFHHRMAR
jgi:hypothetical protein